MESPKSKRLRIFAGPNGSGKTTLAKKLALEAEFHLKIFVNADEIEKQINDNGFLSLNQFELTAISFDQFETFLLDKGMAMKKMREKGTNSFNVKSISFSHNTLYFQQKINSYIASDIASFIRMSLLEEEKSFAFETVFSHESKLEFMKEAKLKGYKVYLYFLTTDDPEININRVNLRVEKNGHYVDPEKIRDRYYRSLSFLFDAIKVSYRSFLFDNSGQYYELVAQIESGKKVEILDVDGQIPNWFVEYFYNKVSPQS